MSEQTHHVYVPQGTISELVAYLANKPAGRIRILLVGDDDPVRALLIAITADTELAGWVKAKMESGLLTLKETDEVPELGNCFRAEISE